MDCGPDILTEDSKVFAKIEAVAKLLNRLLPLHNLDPRCRRQQPACERSVAGACAGHRKKFKQRSFSKDIQVGRVRMRGIKFAVGAVIP